MESNTARLILNFSIDQAIRCLCDAVLINGTPLPPQLQLTASCFVLMKDLFAAPFQRL